MAEGTKPSFIPKRSPNKKQPQQRAVRRVYILDYIAYIIFFGGLISSAGVFVYHLQASNELVQVQESLVAERSVFSEAEMREVLEFEQRIEAAFGRVKNNISLSYLFSELEQLVVETVRFDSLKLERNEDTEVNIEVPIFTNSLNSTIFQRRVLNGDEMVRDISVNNIAVTVDR